jgi:hypothetical protein
LEFCGPPAFGRWIIPVFPIVVIMYFQNFSPVVFLTILIYNHLWHLSIAVLEKSHNFMKKDLIQLKAPDPFEGIRG